MALTAHQRRQLARIEAELRREDPDLAHALARLRPRAPSRRSPVFEALAPLAVNVVGVVMLIVGALQHHIPIVVAGVFLGSCGPLITVVAVRLLQRHRERRRRPGLPRRLGPGTTR